MTTHESFEMPPRSPTIVGSAVETIVESSDASSITSISAAKIGPIRCAGGGAALIDTSSEPALVRRYVGQGLTRRADSGQVPLASSEVTSDR